MNGEDSVTGPSGSMRIAFGADDLGHPQMRAMHAYWQVRRGDARAPHMRTIDPLALPRSALAYLSVIEVEAGTGRFRNRLFGTAAAKATGEDQTGCFIDEMPGTEEQLERFRWCVQNCRPYLARDRLSWSPKRYNYYDVLALPFLDDDGRVARLIFVFHFDADQPDPAC